MSVDPADVAARASFDQDVAAGNEALDDLVDHVRAGLADLPPDLLLAGLLLELAERGHTTVTAIAGLAVVRLAKRAP